MEPQDHDSPNASSDATAAADQRTAARFQYEYVQGVLPLRGDTPDVGDFREVVCHDLSLGGFSFYLESEPDFEELVAALGRRPEIVQVRARVVHVKPIDGDGSPRYLVGCRFLERLDGVV